MDTLVCLSLYLHFVTHLPCIHAILMPDVNKSREEEERGEEKRTTVEKEPVPDLEPTLKKPGEVNETDVIPCCGAYPFIRYSDMMHLLGRVHTCKQSFLRLKPIPLES